jgi:outer membrane lipoprotein-sorting protein
LTLDLPEKYATISLEFSDFETNGQLRPGVFDVKPPVGAKVVYLPK